MARSPSGGARIHPQSGCFLVIIHFYPFLINPILILLIKYDEIALFRAKLCFARLLELFEKDLQNTFHISKIARTMLAVKNVEETIHSYGK